MVENTNVSNTTQFILTLLETSSKLFLLCPLVASSDTCGWTSGDDGGAL